MKFDQFLIFINIDIKHFFKKYLKNNLNLNFNKK